MALKVHTLTVRRQFESDLTPSGLHRPRVFRATARDFTDYREQLWAGRRLRTLRTLRIPMGVRYEYQTISVRPDQQWAVNYAAACKDLQATPAGGKARELLLGSLEPYQRRDAERLGYFDFGLLDRGRVDDDLERGQPPQLDSAMFRIDRRFPNGNILIGLPNGDWRWKVCLHPLTPYPLDDICLTQMLMILYEPNTFIRLGNISEIKSNRDVEINTMWGKPHRDNLQLPFLKSDSTSG